MNVSCRYRSKGVLLGIVRPKVRWADVEAIKSELHKQLEALLGPLSEEDLKEPEKKKKKVHAWNPLYAQLTATYCILSCLLL